MKLTEKVVLITGASEGIGLATVQLFARVGAKLALVARSAEKLEQVASSLPDAIAIPTDLRDEQSVKQMIKRVQEHYGNIDVVINNAGQGMHVPVEHINLDHYRSVFELNVVSVVGVMQAVIPIMRAQGGGVIVNISSGLSKMIVSGVSPYASTKYALNTITLTARQELATDNIRVGLVYPGMTATAFYHHLPDAQTRSENRESSQTLTMTIESADQVAEKILEAVESEAVEVYADNLTPFLPV